MALDAERLYRRANEILEAMPEDDRSDQDRIAESAWVARQELTENGAGPDAPDRPFALSLCDFVADKRKSPDPLLGTEDDCLLPEHGLGLLVAKGGKGKTTFCIDLGLHLASGVDFLGIPVERPLKVLFIENEGPREPFRRKLERRLEAWEHELEGEVYIHDQNWGHARLDLPEFVSRLNAFCADDRHRVDLVIGDPLDSLGMDGEGSPSETRAMVDRFKAAGLFSERAWFLPHHGRKDSAEDAVDEASGAWGGRPDTMLALEKRSDNQARLSFAKVRWQARERHPHILDFDPETEAFTFAREEEGEERDYLVEVEELLEREPHQTADEIVAAIGAGKAKVRETLEGHPDRFRYLTGAAAKAIGRHPNSKVWCLDSPQSPDSPDTISPGVSVGQELGLDSGLTPIGSPETEPVQTAPPTGGTFSGLTDSPDETEGPTEELRELEAEADQERS